MVQRNQEGASMKIVIEDKKKKKKEDGGAALVGYPMYEILKMNFWAF